MMRLYPILVAGIAASTLTGCGHSGHVDSGPRIDRNFALSGFTGVQVAGAYDITVHSGPATSVSANGSEKALDDMRVEVKDGTLVISHAQHRLFGFGWGGSQSAGPVSVVVTVPGLDHAVIAGSGGIAIDKIGGPRFKGEVAGSGDLKLATVDADDVSFEIAGSGGIIAAGKAKSVTYEIAGSGDIDAAGLIAETAKLSIAGSGGIKGHATGTADIEILGSGDVTLTGGAKCTIEKHGSGDVRCW
jgi:carbon monoxide dehydrogenase subunit G